jgi:hypothetical protein
VGCHKCPPPPVKINKMEYVIGSLKNSGDLIGRPYKGGKKGGQTFDTPLYLLPI